ncbi:B12-binding domain-containing radical SAM protein, partial [Acidobacteria bacterium AH-259-O06]|nr:B12-binding domain-containing radical SAM protein [Acidobacteria bacterium AH-259-O06]
MVQLLQKYGVKAGLFIMLGYEGKSIHDIEMTVNHLKQANPDAFLTTVAYPIKGTPYYEEVAERVIPLKAWEEGSDRDLTIAGRHSGWFYSFATRWMVGEVLYHKQRLVPDRDYVRMTKALINAKI